MTGPEGHNAAESDPGGTAEQWNRLEGDTLEQRAEKPRQTGDYINPQQGMDPEAPTPPETDRPQTDGRNLEGLTTDRPEYRGPEDAGRHAEARLGQARRDEAEEKGGA